MDYDFPSCLKFEIEWEGTSFEDVPDDSGGPTRYGITQQDYDDWRDELGQPLQSVEFIDYDTEVKQIYLQKYWQPSGCDTLPIPLRFVVFDCAVNMGVGTAQEFLKESCGDCEDFNNRREARYREYAEVGNQAQFLEGWLNRLNDLRNLIQNVPSSASATPHAPANHSSLGDIQTGGTLVITHDTCLKHIAQLPQGSEIPSASELKASDLIFMVPSEKQYKLKEWAPIESHFWIVLDQPINNRKTFFVFQGHCKII